MQLHSVQGAKLHRYCYLRFTIKTIYSHLKALRRTFPDYGDAFTWIF